jgi:hypothetical protein
MHNKKNQSINRRWIILILWIKLEILWGNKEENTVCTVTYQSAQKGRSNHDN